MLRESSARLAPLCSCLISIRLEIPPKVIMMRLLNATKEWRKERALILLESKFFYNFLSGLSRAQCNDKNTWSFYLSVKRIWNG
jgi:hypothetical protein